MFFILRHLVKLPIKRTFGFFPFLRGVYNIEDVNKRGGVRTQAFIIDKLFDETV